METVITPKLKEEIISAEQYLKEERAGIREFDGKYEFHEGKKILMGGAIKEHNAISTNLTGLIWSFIRDQDFQLYHSDMRTFTPKTKSYFYPDLVVVKGEPQFQDDTFDNLLNPYLLIEILSKSTSSFDKGDKFSAYRSIPSLEHYITISPVSFMIEHSRKIQDNEWNIRIYDKTEEEIKLFDDALTLTMNDIYRNVRIKKNKHSKA